MRAIILAGGSGTRLWPLSREQFPKQFLPLVGEQSLLQDTVERVRPVVGDDVLVVTTEESRFLVADQLRALGLEPEGRILCEPVGRNTAPAIGLAAVTSDPGEVLLVLPSDHTIRDADAFRAALAAAAPVAAAGYLVTFGIAPSYPETGYGYIRLGPALPDAPAFREAAAFVEKPDRARAEEYLASGGYCWNSGMFAFRADAVLDELAAHAPAVRDGLEALRPELAAGRPVPRDLYEAMPSISIDYAVMERSRRVVVLPVEPGWSDLGSFSALFDVLDPDEEGNVVRMPAGGQWVPVRSRKNLVSAGPKVVALVGIEDTLVVDTPDALLVCARERAQDVREVVNRLRAAGREEASVPRTVHRPWGTYTVLEGSERYKIKRIRVNPGAKLSLQLHHHRSEHWVVVSGTARVTRGAEELVLRPNESTFIPMATPHRLENPGLVPLQIIEVQNGEYLGEDDIVRLQDDYGRSEG
ncbi:MAG: mannose-1-phosphate guanylyltransferase/mannose-6-phosphate isomerase [Deltaproteobacteria bacterium]|nr:mannose-1-phosphate guanylyltransferase/mannose-6-phosphate isomerase [Deltaproteobacteria bacterium]